METEPIVDDRSEIGPQPGFQERFLSSRADITIGGGSAGCGKSYAEILANLPWIHLPLFRSVFFRRELAQIEKPGSVWDESQRVYRDFSGEPTKRPFRWVFPSGAQIDFSGIELEDDKYKWQGSQIALLIFDELTHFTASQFWYMQSRNRSMCGIRPYTLATCNPDPDSWVAELISWWIDHETGLPIPERSGVLRYFTRVQDEIVWGDSPADVKAKLPDHVKIAPGLVKSLTFIPGKLEENKILEKADPGYRGNLMGMTRVERARLLDGNWKVRKTAGSYFRRSDVHIVASEPIDIEAVTRRWDLAASEPTEGYPDPDWTCGVKLGRRKDGRFIVLHVELARKRANEVRELVKRVAEHDGRRCSVGVPQDPAQAGKDQAGSYMRDLAGYTVYADKESGNKETRAEPCAAQWQHQNIDVLAGSWNEAFFAQLEAFPDSKVHDDAVDALSGAFANLTKRVQTVRRGSVADASRFI